jgi:hypothetical protein
VPYLGNNQQELALAHIRERIPLANEVNPVVPQELSLIVQRAMAKEPNDRFRMADQLKQVLTSYRDKGRESTMNVNQPPRPATSASPSRPVPPATIPGGTTTPPPPPPSLPTQPRQAVASQPTPPPPMGSNIPPTQRYNVAPEAPGQNQFNRPGVAPAQPLQPSQQAAPSPLQQPYIPPANLRGDSGQYMPQQYGNSEPLRDIPPVLDGVTVVLAMLAFVAVACLIPLYIAVFSAMSA